MNNIALKIVGIILLLSMGIQAGSKQISPVDAPVIPIVDKATPWYLGLGLVAIKFHACSNDCSYEDLTYGVMVRGGYDYNPYFGIEARYMRTFLDKGPFGGLPIQHIGLFLKPQYPINEKINLYGLLGYGYTKNLGNGARLNYFGDDSGFSAGVGVEYELSEDEWSLFLDYQRLLIASSVPNIDAISFGIRYHF
jgi:OOP family OmpA-OmpF porin